MWNFYYSVITFYIDILREDLSLSIKSAEHKTQLLVGQKICQQPPESIDSWAFWKKDN